VNVISMLLGERFSPPAVHLEPLHDARNGELVGREARWEFEQLSADDQPGLLDRWALRSALAAASEVAHEHPHVLTHVDVCSISDVDRALDLYQWLRTLTPRLHDLPLALEIDERFVVPYIHTIGGFARAVRRLGIAVVVDHARTCKGIEQVLRCVPCDAVKIDASLIQTIAFDTSARKSAAGIVRAAHTLGMYAIADGVLDLETLERVRDLGCDRVQGLAELPI
jgi:EAL domain-containing protein (putative c-di-GMP-specific phosphodiesterase class I)